MNTFYQLGTQLAQVIEAKLDEVGADKPGRVGMVPGDIVWDACNCGLLAISAARLFYSDTFPESVGAPTGRLTPCDFPYVVCEYVIHLIRCAPQSPTDALEPTVDALSAAAGVLVVDARAVQEATAEQLCEWRHDDTISDALVGELRSVGPAGDCVGVELRAYVGIERRIDLG